MPAGQLNALVLEVLADRTPRTAEEIAAALGADMAAIRACLTRLLAARRVLRALARGRPGWTLPERP